MDNMKMAELLFPNVERTPEEYEKMYPVRNLPEGAKVTRLGPSPTGFIHLGNLYGAFVDERLAHRSGGVFYLRIEDTDDKRYVEGAVKAIIDSLAFFGINFDEGATLSGDIGDYGDYTQSRRGDIYRSFARRLVEEKKAYPCFLTEEEIGEIRKGQEEKKINPGIYGRYAIYRDITAQEAEERIKAGQTYVIRLRSEGNGEGTGDDIRRVRVEDGIRGAMEVPENFQDVVILKATGIPTYHFAHVVDDHLMRTTHVVRGGEWLSSLPIHVELFEKLGWDLPVYCHTAQLMKLDENGNKRKLSKRSDPELSLTYYREQGYHPAAVREYLMTILNSNFEEWRMENPERDIDEFPFTTEKMSSSGALFDLNKLNDVSKEVLLRTPACEIYDFLKSWSEEFAPELQGIFSRREYVERILDLGRNDQKPRKDLIYARQIVDFIGYFFDEMFKVEDEMPAEVSPEDQREILEKYLASYDHRDDQRGWFDKIRNIAAEMGYAAKPKDFKKNPDQYKGHVGHVSTVIRIGVMGRAQSPDLWSIQQIMGEEMTRRRIESFLSSTGEY